MAKLVTDFLRYKWRQGHRFLDTNKDGILTEDDFIAIADNISKMSNATEKESINTRKEWLKWYHLFQPDPSVVIDEDRFQALCEELNTTGVENYKKITEIAIDMIDRIDIDGDGFISLDEFEIFYEAVGIKDKSLTIRNYTKIDQNCDGKIQREEYIDEMVRHVSDPDPITGVTFLFKNADEKEFPVH